MESLVRLWEMYKVIVTHLVLQASKDVAFSTENEQVANDLLVAARNITSILHKNGEYYRDMQTHLAKLEESIITIQPSEPELKMVRQRWAGFLAALEPLITEIGRIQRRLEEPPPRTYRADDPVTQTIIDRMNRGNAPTNAPPEPGLKLLDAPPTAQTVSVPPPSISAHPWKSALSFFRRLLSCFVPKKPQ